MADKTPQAELLASWLNNAYAMEQEIIEVLEAHRDQAEDFPEVQEKIKEHLEVTKRQAERVKECLDKIGSSASGIKVGLGKIMGTISGISTGPMEDTMLKNAVAEIATENLEIATYHTIIELATIAGEDSIARVCEEIMNEEAEMEEWLHQNHAVLVEKVVSKKEE